MAQTAKLPGAGRISSAMFAQGVWLGGRRGAYPQARRSTHAAKALGGHMAGATAGANTRYLANREVPR